MIKTEMTNEDYHNHPAISASRIMLFNECPRLFLEPFKENDAMVFGQMAHLNLLEGKLEEFFAIADFEDRRGNKWKDFVAQAELIGKKPCLRKDVEEIIAMGEALKRNTLAVKLLTGGKAEMSFFAVDTETGLEIKARPDYLRRINGKLAIIDYKTTASRAINVTQHSKHAFNLKRHVQAAHHKKVVELATGETVEQIIYVIQSVESPYLTRVMRIAEDGIQIGQDICKTALEGIKHCLETGIFPEYPQEIEDMITPYYVQNDFE